MKKASLGNEHFFPPNKINIHQNISTSHSLPLRCFLDLSVNNLLRGLVEYNLAAFLKNDNTMSNSI